MHAAVVSFGDTFQNVFQLPGLRLFCISNPCYTKWRWHLERKYFITVTLVFILPQRLQFLQPQTQALMNRVRESSSPTACVLTLGTDMASPKRQIGFFYLSTAAGQFWKQALKHANHPRAPAMKHT